MNKLRLISNLCFCLAGRHQIHQETSYPHWARFDTYTAWDQDNVIYQTPTYSQHHGRWVSVHSTHHGHVRICDISKCDMFVYVTCQDVTCLYTWHVRMWHICIRDTLEYITRSDTWHIRENESCCTTFEVVVRCLVAAMDIWWPWEA